jgi:hypothetical protein
MAAAAQTAVSSQPVSAAIFAFMALALFLFAAYMGVRASLDASYLRTLELVPASLSTAFAIALTYQTVALATRRAPTISHITAAAFSAHPGWWVTAFGILMAATGALAVHFTRVAHPASSVVVTQHALGGTIRPVLLAAAFGLALVAATLLVVRLTPLVAKPGPDDPGFSWWVLFLGGGTYGLGALVAWAANWRP